MSEPDDTCRNCNGSGITGGTVIDPWYCPCCDGGGRRVRRERPRATPAGASPGHGNDPAKAG